jgi:uncharacterized protein YdeI (YjbR/CyaY-like superfamily)
VNTFSASTAISWRAWLEQNCRSEREVWLVIHHKNSGKPGVRYDEAIEHALCFGWIDSQARKRDADSFHLRFTPRNPNSTWSRVNRQRAAKMTGLGLMTEAGQALIEAAKANGTWQIPDGAESSAIPGDLQELLDRNETARTNFHKFPPSSKRLILQWIATAKRPDTRRRRIDQTVSLAAVNTRANHPGIRAHSPGKSAANPSNQRPETVRVAAALPTAAELNGTDPRTPSPIPRRDCRTGGTRQERQPAQQNAESGNASPRHPHH